MGKRSEDQFQVGDEVLYEPEGVVTTVDGYLWLEAVGSLPEIGAYRLACGVSVPGSSLKRWLVEE